MAEDQNKKTTISIPDDLKEKLKAEAEAQHRSVRNLIMQILWEYFEKKNPPV